MNIPKWISRIYYKVDKNKDGIITKDEIHSLDRAKEGIGTIYQFEEGMTLKKFVLKNKSIFSEYIHFEGEPSYGREILKDGKLVKTNIQRNTSVDNKDNTEVMQGEYCIASVKDTKYLQTYGIGPCVAVTIYDPINKKGFMTHIDTSNKAQNLSSIINKLKNNNFDLKNCEVSIIGGQHAKETVKIIKEIIENNDITIKEMDVLGFKVRSIQLNLETGEVTDYKETIHVRNDLEVVALRTLINDKLNEYKVPKEEDNKFGL